MWRLTQNLSFIPWLFSIEGGLIPWLFIIEGGPRLLKGVIKIGFVAFDPKHLFYPWLFSIEGGRGGGGQNYWWGKLSEKRAFFGKFFRGAKGTAKNRPFCQIFRRYGGGQNPILPLDMTLGCICSPLPELRLWKGGQDSSKE